MRDSSSTPPTMPVDMAFRFDPKTGRVVCLDIVMSDGSRAVIPARSAVVEFKDAVMGNNHGGI